MIPGDLKLKDPGSVRTAAFNLDAYLAAGVHVVSPTVVTAGPDAGLTTSNVTLSTDRRSFTYQLAGGTLKKRYRVTAHFSTDETPPQTDSRSIDVQVEAL